MRVLVVALREVEGLAGEADARVEVPVDAAAAGGVDEADARVERAEVPAGLRGDDEALIELRLLGDRRRRHAGGRIRRRRLEELLLLMSERRVRELDVVETVVLRRVRREAQPDGGARVAAEVVDALAALGEAGVVIGVHAEVELKPADAAERVLQLVHAALDRGERGVQAVPRLVAVEQLADGALAGAVLVDRAAHRVGHALDRVGQPRDLRLQLRGDRLRVRHRGVDVHPVRGDEVAHLLGDVVDVRDDVLQLRLPIRRADRRPQRLRDRLHVGGDGGDLVGDLVDRGRLRARQRDALLLLADDRLVGRAGLELDILLAEEPEVGDVRLRVGAQLHVLVDLHLHLSLAIVAKVDLRDLADADAGHAHGRTLVEPRDGVEDGGDFLVVSGTADLHVLDLEDEEAEDAENHQHERADFCSGRHSAFLPPGGQRVNAGALEHPDEQSKGQSNDVRVAAVDGVDEHRPDALRGVGAGLVEPLAAARVPVDLALRHRRDAHLGLGDARVAIAARGVHDRDGGVDDVDAPGDGGRAHLGDVARDDVEVDADRAEELPPPRRAGSEDEPQGAALPMLTTTTKRASATMR